MGALFFTYSSLQLLLLLYSLGLAMSDDPVKEMRRYTDQFKDLSAAAADILQGVGKVTAQTASFLKLAGPISSLVVAAIETRYKPESPEYKAINDLRVETKQGVASLSQQIDDLENVINFMEMAHGYNDKISTPLGSFFEDLEDVLPGLAPTNSSEFKLRCLDMYASPKGMLNWMNENIGKENCPPPTADEARFHAWMLEIFMRVEDNIIGFATHHHHHNQEELLPYLRKKEDTITLMRNMPLWKARREFKTIQKELFGSSHRSQFPRNGTEKIWLTASEVARRIGRALVGLEAEAERSLPRCILQISYDRYHQRRENILSIINALRLDVARLTLAGGLCLNYTAAAFYNNSLADAIRPILRRVISITTSMEEWGKKTLEAAWYTYTELGVKRALMKFDPRNRGSYDEFAKRSVMAANERGLSRWKHNVQISRVLQLDIVPWEKQHAHICNEAFCQQFTNQLAEPWYHVFITRFEEDEVQRSRDVDKWYNNTWPTIYRMIQANESSENLPSLLDYINTELGGALGNPTLFRSVNIVRDSQWYWHDLDITLGVKGSYAPYNQAAYKELRFLDYALGKDWNAEDYRCYFSL